MKHTDVFTEEGMTRLRNFRRRAAGYFAVWLLAGLCVSGGLVWVKIRYGLAPLQRIYLRTYVRAKLKTLLSAKSQAPYRLLVRVVSDPATGQETVLRVTDADAYPVLNERGHIVRDPQLGLQFQLQPGLPSKYFYWHTGRGRDTEMVAWMHQHIYDGVSLFGMCAPMLLAGGVVFLVGIVATMARDRWANKKYEKGRAIRGTRRLSPRAYERAHPDATGIGLLVYEPKRKRS